MRITMPTVNVAKHDNYDTCVLYLVINNTDPTDVCTVVVSSNEVIYFGSDHSICRSGLEYLKENYKLIRKLAPGEQLNIVA